MIAQTVMTTREAQVLHFIQDHIGEKGYPPTTREIAKSVGLLSASAVHKQLNRLERDGFIERDGGARALRLTAKGCPRSAGLEAFAREACERFFRADAAEAEGLTAQVDPGALVQLWTEARSSMEDLLSALPEIEHLNTDEGETE